MTLKTTDHLGTTIGRFEWLCCSNIYYKMHSFLFLLTCIYIFSEKPNTIQQRYFAQHIYRTRISHKI